MHLSRRMQLTAINAEEYIAAETFDFGIGDGLYG
jgi:hypothetical protein